MYLQSSARMWRMRTLPVPTKSKPHVEIYWRVVQHGDYTMGLKMVTLPCSERVVYLTISNSRSMTSGAFIERDIIQECCQWYFVVQDSDRGEGPFSIGRMALGRQKCPDLHMTCHLHHLSFVDINEGGIFLLTRPAGKSTQVSI